MSDDKLDLLAPSSEFEDEHEDEDYGKENTAISIQISDGQTIDPNFEESEQEDSGLPVEATVQIKPLTLDKNQPIKSKPAVLRTVSNSQNDNIQIIRMPISFPNPLSRRNTNGPEYDAATEAALNRYKYYKHIEKYTSPAEPVLVMPEHVLPDQFFTALSFSPSPGKQKSIVTIFALWNTMMGTALLSMPYSLKKAGFVNGISLLILIAFLMFYSAYRIMSSAKLLEHLRFVDFSDVCRYFLGPLGYILCNLCSLISLIGGMIVYWILLSNFMFNSVKYFFYESNGGHFNNLTGNSSVLCPFRNNDSQIPDDSSNPAIQEFNTIWQLTRTVPFFLLLFLFPLINFKSPSFFTKFNSLASISVLYLIIFTFVKAFKWGINIQFTSPSEPFYSPNFNMTFPALTGIASLAISMTLSLSLSRVLDFNMTFPALTGIAALAYFIHNCIIAIVQNQEKPENNCRDLGIAFSLVCITYLIIGVGLYITFPDDKICIEDNILNNLPLNDIFAVIARVFIFLQLGAIFPLLIYVFRIQFLHVLFKIVWPGLHWIILLNLLICALCIMFACLLPFIGKVIGIVGAFCGFSYALALPFSVYLLSCKEKGTLTSFKLIIHVILILLGLANFIAQFFVH